MSVDEPHAAVAAHQLPKVSPPPHLVLTSNIVENWKLWRQMWLNYAVLTQLEKHPKEYQAALFLHAIGPEALQVYNGLPLTEDEKTDLKKIIEKFDEYTVGEVNETYERYIFNNRLQKDESIEQYVTALRNLTRSCNHCECMSESLLRDRIVTGIRDVETRKVLLQTRNLDLDSCIRICKAMEMADVRLKAISTADKNESETPLVHKVSFNNKDKFQKYRRRTNCKYCGGEHPFQKEKCPAYGQRCSKCNIRNHFSKVCRQSKESVHSLDTNMMNAEYDDEEGINVISLTDIAGVNSVSKGNSKSAIFAEMIIEHTAVKFQIDSGAETNIVTKKYIGNTKLEKTDKILLMWNRTVEKPIGVCTLQVINPANNKQYMVNFTVVNDATGCTPLLGMNAAERMGILAVNEDQFRRVQINHIQPATDTSMNIISKFQSVFDGSLGRLPGKVKLFTDPTINTHTASPRRVPVAIRDKLKHELDRLVDMHVITPVQEPTEWVSNLVVTTKKSGDIRVCIDPKRLNEALKRPAYQTPTLEEVLPELAKAKLFTVCDLQSAFWHLELDSSSSELTTFITPYGRYRYLRLPYGLKVSGEIFQQRVHRALEGLDGVFCIADDIIIAGLGPDDNSATADHDKKLEKLLIRCTEQGIKLNKTKLKLKQQEVTFFGHLLTNQGLKPDPEKVRAIINFPRPECPEDVSRINGLINYLSKFLNQLSSVMQPLRELMHVNVGEWNWTDRHEETFQNIKRLATTAPILAYYDPNEELRIQCDASSKGLGSCLMQNGKPVYYASRALTHSETKWAQIEKELLAVVYSLEKFHQYAFGRPVVVESDHKPLETIIKKPLHAAPRRLQSLLLRLQVYNVSILHKPGKEMLIADALSRAYLPEVPLETDEAEHVNMVNFLPIADERLKQIRSETERDSVLQQLKQTIISGWPDEKSKTIPCLLPYFPFRDELSAQNGLIFKGERVVIPHNLRTTMKIKIHSTHLGIEGCLRRAREAIYWPGMNAEIKEYISGCETCAKFNIAQQPEELKPHEIPERAFQKIGVDLFTFNAKEYMVTVCYYSNYFEIDYLSQTNATAIINRLKRHFARFGIPDIVFSDNGPQFSSNEFRTFAKVWEFTHSTSSPYYAKSNGKAESAVKIAKRLIKKTCDSGADLQLALLDYRNTPIQYLGASPVQLMMQKRTKTLLPIAHKLLKPQQDCRDIQVSQRIIENKEKQMYYYNRKAKNLDDLQKGQPVRIAPTDGTGVWKKGCITRDLGQRSYEVATDAGTTTRRNRVQLRPAPDKPPADDSGPTVEDAANITQQTPSSSSPSPLRRSERICQRPKHLSDFVP